MNLYKKIERIKAEIVDTERLLEMVNDHPLMSIGMQEKLDTLRRELNSLPTEVFDPKVNLLFSGNAVVGSQGIKSTFLSKALPPFQEMIKTQTAIQRFGRINRRSKNNSGSELFLTALPKGSFGVELSQLNSDDLFDGIDVSKAMKDVMDLIHKTSLDDNTIFENILENTPKRSLLNLKRFLKEVSRENSVLKMESGANGIELSNNEVQIAYNRVAAAVNDEDEEIIEGTLRGILLDSSKFEIQDEEGTKYSGSISDELSEEELVDYDKRFLNQVCVIHLKIYKTVFVTGKEKINYELLQITEKNLATLFA